MSAVATRYLELVVKLPPGSVLILNDVHWEDYENLLEELGDQQHIRVSYDQGRMEVMTVSWEHEGWKTLFPHLVKVLTEELNLPLRGAGSVTLKRELEARGKEPDECYYITHFQAVRGKRRISLETDPPPDLAVEVDITSPSLNKFPIYASVGVPEIWLFDGVTAKFYRLTDEEYVEIPASDLFPFLTPAVLTDFLRLGESDDLNQMTRAFREWVRQHRPGGKA
jgi:Uma2 family endonuclease